MEAAADKEGYTSNYSTSFHPIDFLVHGSMSDNDNQAWEEQVDQDLQG